MDPEELGFVPDGEPEDYGFQADDGGGPAIPNRRVLELGPFDIQGDPSGDPTRPDDTSGNSGQGAFYLTEDEQGVTVNPLRDDFTQQSVAQQWPRSESGEVDLDADPIEIPIGRDRSAEAFPTGILDFLSFGTLDEIGGDRVRETLRSSQEQYPDRFLAGQLTGAGAMGVGLGGGLVARAPGLSGKIGAGAIEGSAIGLGQALGHSEGTLGERLQNPDVYGETALSGAVGGVAVPVAQGAARGVSAAARGAGRLADRLRGVSQNQRVAAATGGGVSNLRRFDQLRGGIPAAADDIERLGLSGPLTSTNRSGELASEVVNEAGPQIREIISKASSLPDDIAGQGSRLGADGIQVGNVDVTSTISRLRSMADETAGLSGGASRARTASRMADELEAFRQTGMSFDDAQAQKRLWGELMESRGGNPTARQQVIREAYPSLVEDMELAANRVADEGVLDPELAGRYGQLRRDFTIAKRVEESAHDRALREASNNVISPTEQLAMVGVGATTGDVGSAIQAGLLQRLFRGRQHSIAASTTKLLSGAMMRGGDELGAFAQEFANQAPRQMAATHFQLSQRSPEYRLLIERLRRRQRAEQELEDNGNP